MRFFLLSILFYVFVPLCRASFLPDNAFSKDAAGTAGAAILKYPPTARFEALGKTGVSMVGPDAIFLNPAGMYSLSGRSVLFGYERMLEDTYRTHAAYINSGYKYTYGVGVLFWNYGPLKGYDAKGDFTRYFSSYDAAAYLSFSKTADFLRWGVTFKAVKSRVEEESGATFAFDAGMIAADERPGGSDIAVSVRNIGPPVKVGKKSDPLPLELSVSFLNHYTPDLDMVFEGKMPADGKPYLAVGAEYSLGGVFFLRGGINLRNQSELGVSGALGAGFGVKIGKAALDYAFVPYGDLGKTHRLSLSLGFGAKRAFFSGPAIGAETDEEKKRLRASFSPDREKPAVAVAAFTRFPPVSADRALAVTGMFEGALRKTGRFKLVERSEKKYILAEKALSASGIITEDIAPSFGRMLDCEYIVLGTVSGGDEGYSLYVKVMRVGDGRIVASGIETAGNEYLLMKAARKLADKMGFSI